jgi:hypothetical protein
VLGGHLDYVLKGQEPRMVLISQMKDVAVENLVSIRLCLESSPFGKREIKDALADEIKLKNGISIVASSPNIKAQRGLALPVVGMDEVGFWYKDAEAANPDFEVVRAVSAAQAQFPRRKRFGISSVWSKEGLLWEHHLAGTEGRLLKTGGEAAKRKYKHVLVVEASTASMLFKREQQQDEHGRPARPHIDREYLETEQARDPEGFDREYLCKFLDSLSKFITRERLEQCVEGGIGERPPIKVGSQDYNPEKGLPLYVAVMDPAFRRDAYAFGIVHHERGKGIVVDKVQRWVPRPARDKGKSIKLKPDEVMEEILPDLRAYGISHIYSDQYQLESLQALYGPRGVVVEGFDFTTRSKNQICLNLESLVNQQRVWLPDPKAGVVQHQLFEEVVGLEKVLRPNGTFTVQAQAGQYDDMAMMLALAAFKAMWLVPEDPAPEPLPEEHQPKTAFQRAQAQIMAKHGEEDKDEWDD